MDRSPTRTMPRLLVADENPTTCTFLQDNLTADGYQVDAAATGQRRVRLPA